MKRNKQQDEVDQKWNQIEGHELDKLRHEMEAKKQIRINGRLQSRFTQVMLDRGYVRFPKEKELASMGDKGALVVVNAGEYTRMLRAESMIEASDRKQEDSYFEAYPEEAAKNEARIARWMNETREMLRSVVKRI